MSLQLNKLVKESAFLSIFPEINFFNMKAILPLLLLIFILGTFNVNNVKAQNMKISDKQRLAVVWTSSDPEVAEKVCFMYTHNARLQEWFDEVVLIVWGPSAKLLSENNQLQERVKKMIADGVKVEACIACANMYGVADQLKALGIEVKGMGPVLTAYLKDDWKVLTF
jgi:hypothetical protein